MATKGFVGPEDSRGFNGGLGEEHRVTHIEYRLAASPDEVIEATEAALAHFEPKGSEGYYVIGSTLPKGSVRLGARFVPYSDPLQDLSD